jgi:hypothetical protein
VARCKEFKESSIQMVNKLQILSFRADPIPPSHSCFTQELHYISGNSIKSLHKKLK